VRFAFYFNDRVFFRAMADGWCCGYRYGYTDAGRNVLAQQKTGSSHNPFAIQQQQQQQQNERPFFDI
jgi:hypothetical protein